VISLITAGFWLFAPFHFERGTLGAREGLVAINGYFWSNIGEELVFRGYVLIVLIRRFGLRAALAATALIFGLFHLPGQSGLGAVKMVFTTAAFSYLLSAAFLTTGTLWTAIALHFGANVLLHKITGLSGGVALVKPVLQGAYPSYDPAFFVTVAVPLLGAWLMFSRSAGAVTVPIKARDLVV
jgi:membrane protease YdiL (CAAX protease family)